MAKPPRPWIVTRHDPIEKLEDNLWAVQGDVPGIPFKRRMFIVKRSDGALMFFGSAVPLEEDLLAEIKAWGRPAFLVLPHEQHMIDARAFAEKLGLEIYGPKVCADKMRTRAELAGTLEDVPADANVRIEPVAGAKNGEPAIVVTSAGGARTSLLIADAIQNNPKGSLGLLPRLCGFAGGPKVVPVFKMMFLSDKKALKGQLEQWAALPGLARVIPCHGDPVTASPGPALKHASALL
ncbi:MAG TPA: hypothetical protein VMT47_01510 [Polyangia bacterium]|nr:hypothetical protein [Polyangia bacterium]